MVEMYHGSDGEYYSEDELHRQYASGRWQFCMGDTETGREVVQTETDDLLTLTPLRGGTLGAAPDSSGDRAADGDADGADPGPDDAPAVSYVPSAGHCRDCGEPLTVEPCPNCEARKRLDDG